MLRSLRSLHLTWWNTAARLSPISTLCIAKPAWWLEQRPKPSGKHQSCRHVHWLSYGTFLWLVMLVYICLWTKCKEIILRFMEFLISPQWYVYTVHPLSFEFQYGKHGKLDHDLYVSRCLRSYSCLFSGNQTVLEPHNLSHLSLPIYWSFTAYILIFHCLYTDLLLINEKKNVTRKKT